ncbi:MAG: hypothetical protein Q9174_005745 [Haloplaca sp. 1 TL-2023]
MTSAIDGASLPSHTRIASIDKSEREAKLPRLTPRRKPPPRSRDTQPTPETPSLPPPPDLQSLTFQEPKRRILSPQDLKTFQSSHTNTLLTSFVFSLSSAAADRKISSMDLPSAPQPIHQILAILSSITSTIEECPPENQNGSRFGNPAFRSFLSALSTKSASWHTLLSVPDAAHSELSTYLHNSFGNLTRIDYGSGHELNFITWLLCLNRLSILPPSTFPALALVIFPKYIHLMRLIQKTYYLEPAGSHGVWGLDDYHFLPFLIGASQLLHHPYITPLSIHNDLILEEEADEYLYLDMVRETQSSKSVKGLRWTQPMLDDISGAKGWGKVEGGMRRMFLAEVLGKLPVMQHFLFGSLVPAAEGMGSEDEVRGMRPEEKEREGGEVEVVVDSADGTGEKEGKVVKHVHREDAWGDCCGIKIPSTVAAAQEARKNGENEGFRRIPFD